MQKQYLGKHFLDDRLRIIPFISDACIAMTDISGALLSGSFRHAYRMQFT